MGPRPDSARHRTPFARRHRAARAAAIAMATLFVGGMTVAPVLAANAPAATAVGITPFVVHGRLKTGPDVTTRARAQSVRIGGLWHVVTRWRGACISSGVTEVFLAAAQRALAGGQLSGARAILDASRTVLHNEVHRHMISAHRYAWYSHTEQAILLGMPSYGHVRKGVRFPGPPRVLRCTAQTPDSRPSNNRAATLRAGTTDTSYLATPTQEDAIHSAVTVALGAVPEAIGAVAPEVEIPGVVGGVLSELANLFWPSSSPAAPPVDSVTWDDMTTYVNNRLNSAIDQINQVIAANRLAEIQDDLTALHTAINTYTTDLDNLTPSPGTFGGYSDVDRARAFALYSTLNQAFTSIIPHFTDDPTSFRNLPETINLYTLYMTTLRGWILTPDTFNSDPTAAAKWQAARETDLKNAIAKATSVVSTQLPQLEASEGAGEWPLDQGWNRHWSVMDAITPAGYDQVWYWKYMDPVAYPPNPTTGRIASGYNPSVLATPCYGAYTEPTALTVFTGLPTPEDPTSVLDPQLTDPRLAASAFPLSKITLWGVASSPSELTGLQLANTNGSTGAVSGNTLAGGSNTPPLGADIELGPTQAGFVTRVNGTYTGESIGVPANQINANAAVTFGGAVHAQFTTTTTNAAGTSVSTTGPMIPSGSPGPESYDVSFPGYVLSWIGMPQTILGTPFSSGWGDQCIAFGFRLQDSY